MSTELHNRQDAPLELMPEAVGDMRAAIVTARFNSDITYALRDAALKTFKDAGIDDSVWTIVSLLASMAGCFGFSALCGQSKHIADTIMGAMG